MNELIILANQQITFTLENNLADLSVVIDAIQILQNQRFNDVSQSTSDGGFTDLTTRLKDSETRVNGVDHRVRTIKF